jgi:hypothetical protein
VGFAVTESLATALRCIDCETGLKTEAVPPAREAVALRRLVGDRLGGHA